MAAGADATVHAASSGPRRRTQQLRAWAAGVSPDTWALLAIAGAVVLANLPYLLDFFDPNPMGPRSGLVSALVPGRFGGGPTIDPNNAFISQALSHRAALDLLHLHLPWWNPYEATGAPLLGEIQSAALFPPTLLTLLSNGQLYEHMLLEIVAGIATYLLLRRISIGRWISSAAAIAFALNGTFAWLAHATVNPVAFLPLLLLGIELAYSASVEGRRGGWWLIAVSVALSLYAGFPEVAYIDALLALCWFAWRSASIRRQRLHAFVLKSAAGAAAGALLAAPLLIAALDYLNHGNVGHHQTGFFGGAHLPAQILPQLALPYVFGLIFEFPGHNLVLTNLWGIVGGYLDSSLLLFALLGLFARRRRGLRLALLVWIVLAFSRMYSEPPLLGHIIGVLPGMSHVAFFRYATSSLEFSVIVLAALGLDDLLRAPDSRRRLAWAAVASLAVVAGAAIGAQPLIDQLGATFRPQRYFAAAVAWAALVVIAAAACALVRAAKLRVRLLAVLLALDAIVMFTAPELSAPRAVQLDLAPVAYLKRHLGSSRFFTLGPIAPNYGSYFGLPSLNINDLPIPSAFGRYVHTRLDQVVDPTVFVGNYGGDRSLFAPSPEQELERNLTGYREAAVRYVLTPAGQPLPQSPDGLRLVLRTPSTWIYQLAGAQSYFSATGGCRISAVGFSSARVRCATPAVLTRRETDLPGWSATVDGHEVRIERRDGLFQAIRIPPGAHQVRFSYLPPEIGWGLAGLLAGCAWVLLGPRWPWWSRRTPRQVSSTGA